MFSLLAAFSLTLLVLLPLALHLRWKGNQLFWLTLGFILLVQLVVPLALGSLGQLDYFVMERFAVDNSELKYYGLLFTDLTALGVIVGYVMLRRKSGSHDEKDVGARIPAGLVTAADILCTLGILYLTVAEPHSADRLAFTADSVLSPLTIARHLAFGATVTTFFAVSTRRWVPHTLLNGCALLLLSLFKLGDRSVALAMVLAVFTALTASHQKVGPGLLAVGAGGVYVGLAWQYVRWQLTAGFRDLPTVLWRAATSGMAFTLVNPDGELNYLYKASQTLMAVVPGQAGFLHGASYLRLLLLLLPSTLLPFKPPETQLVIAALFGAPLRASRPATFLGDAWFNFGWFGPLAGIVLGLVVAFVQKRLRPASAFSLAVAGIGPYAVVVWLRGSLNGFASLAIWCLLCSVLGPLLTALTRREGVAL